MFFFFFPFPKYPLNPGYERIYKSQWRISSNPDKPMAFQPPYLCQWRETSGVKNGINYHFCVFHFFKLKYGWFTMFVNSCCTAKWFGYTYIYIHLLFKRKWCKFLYWILFSIIHCLATNVISLVLGISFRILTNAAKISASERESQIWWLCWLRQASDFWTLRFCPSVQSLSETFINPRSYTFPMLDLSMEISSDSVRQFLQLCYG